MTSPFIGQIATFGFYFAPRNYSTCQGQILSIAQNSALFALLGTTYGGNGVQTFGLPDLQGRVEIGQGNGPGLSSYTMGQLAGTENVTLTTAQMPMHIHTLAGTATGSLNAVDIKATEQSPQAGAYLARGVDTAPQANSIPEIYLPAAQGDPATKVPLAGVNVAGNTAVAGGSQPFSNIQPYLVLNKCIALQGIFPSRN